jgi:hypothetical protein
MSGPRGFGLSGAQVIASVLATLTGALAASYLGVGGTLLGPAPWARRSTSTISSVPRSDCGPRGRCFITLAPGPGTRTP